MRDVRSRTVGTRPPADPHGRSTVCGLPSAVVVRPRATGAGRTGWGATTQRRNAMRDVRSRTVGTRPPADPHAQRTGWPGGSAKRHLASRPGPGSSPGSLQSSVCRLRSLSGDGRRASGELIPNSELHAPNSNSAPRTPHFALLRTPHPPLPTGKPCRRGSSPACPASRQPAIRDQPRANAFSASSTLPAASPERARYSRLRTARSRLKRRGRAGACPCSQAA